MHKFEIWGQSILKSIQAFHTVRIVLYIGCCGPVFGYLETGLLGSEHPIIWFKFVLFKLLIILYCLSFPQFYIKWHQNSQFWGSGHVPKMGRISPARSWKSREYEVSWPVSIVCFYICVRRKNPWLWWVCSHLVVDLMMSDKVWGISETRDQNYRSNAWPRLRLADLLTNVVILQLRCVSER